MSDDSFTPSPRPPRRKLVTPERLLQLLNQRLEAYGHCHNCHFAGPVRRLKEPTADGRNWSRYIPLTCANQMASGCVRAAQRIVEDASHEYNLREPAERPGGAPPPRPL